MCRQNAYAGFQYWINDHYDKEEDAPKIVSVHYDSSIFPLNTSDAHTKCSGMAKDKSGQYVQWEGSLQTLNFGIDNGEIIGNAHILKKR